MEKIEPSRSIGRWVGLIHRYSQAYYVREMERLGIGSGQAVYLAELSHMGGLSQDELAKHLMLDKTTITRSLAKLESLGYIERKADKEDRRIKRVYLSEEGEQILPQVMARPSQSKTI